jgi:hypothetical protein
MKRLRLMPNLKEDETDARAASSDGLQVFAAARVVRLERGG